METFSNPCLDLCEESLFDFSTGNKTGSNKEIKEDKTFKLNKLIENLDEHLRCPITYLYFKDTVLCEDGCIYEKDAIAEHLMNTNKSPINRQNITNNFKEVKLFGRLVQTLVKIKPELKDDVYTIDNSYDFNKRKIIKILYSGRSSLLKNLMDYSKFKLYDQLSTCGCGSCNTKYLISYIVGIKDPKIIYYVLQNSIDLDENKLNLVELIIGAGVDAPYVLDYLINNGYSEFNVGYCFKQAIKHGLNGTITFIVERYSQTNVFKDCISHLTTYSSICDTVDNLLEKATLFGDTIPDDYWKNGLLNKDISVIYFCLQNIQNMNVQILDQLLKNRCTTSDVLQEFFSRCMDLTDSDLTNLLIKNMKNMVGDCIVFLLDRMDDFGIADENGWLLIHHVSYLGTSDSILLLITRGVDCSIPITKFRGKDVVYTPSNLVELNGRIKEDDCSLILDIMFSSMFK